MFNGLLSVIALCGAVTCTLLVVVLSLVFANQRREQHEQAAEPLSRMDEKVLRITRLLSTETGGVIDATHRRGPGIIPAQDLRRSLEVANGLQILSQASPGVALHECNITLLAHLREVVGANDFHYMCGRLATVLHDRDPQYQVLACGLENGELSWSSFLTELRGMPMTARF